MAGWQFGCDVCQDVCPWNRKAPTTRQPELVPATAYPGAAAVSSMDDASIREAFHGSALLRAKPAGLRRNALIYLENEA
jgi:epoxyqueuosine reductase